MLPKRVVWLIFGSTPKKINKNLTSSKEEAFCRDGETTTTQQKQMTKLFCSNRRRYLPHPRRKKRERRW
jgi:hypothetical protein